MNYPDNVKEQLLKWVYEKIDLSKYKYKILEKDTDVVDIQKGYYVSHNFMGVNCLLVFVKLSNKFYSFLIDRKTLNYNWAQLDINNVRITPIKARLNKDIYRGSIFDGVLSTNKERKYTITDTFYFRGVNFTEQDVLIKYFNIDAYINAHYVDDQNLNDIKLKVGKTYNLLETKKVSQMHVQDARGLAFLPQKSGIKLLLIDMKLEQNKEEKVKEREIDIYKSIENGKEAVFKIKKTTMTDVYNLYLLSIIKKNGKKALQNKKIGIAYIPTIECSKTVSEILKDKENGLVYCQYDKAKEKWIPTQECKNKNKPSLVSEVYELK